MAFTAAAAAPSCIVWVWPVATPSAATVVESGFAASDFSVSDFAASDFEEAGFDVELPVVSLLEFASLSLRELTAASLESLRAALSDAALSEAVWSDAAVLSRDRSSGVARESSARRGAGVCAGEASCERLSALLAAAVLSTKAAKLSFPAAWPESARADFAGAP
jgi:hypothetical protein